MNADTLKVLVESHRKGHLPAAPSPRAAAGLALGQANAAFYEDILARIETPLTVAATGSFGRGAVALRSDLDLRFVCAKEPPREEDVEAFLYPLWDARIAVGHQILRVDEVLELALQDLSTATSLLDLRALRGETTLVRALLDRAFDGLFGEAHLAAFLQRLEEERDGRHARFCGSVYLLEPDVKNGAGGLRDLDHARWAARARYRFDPRAPTFRELVHVGVLLPREGEELSAAEDFLWCVRNRLHVHADRRSDRLTFEEQEAIAAELDYGSEPSSVERFMQDYYQHARAVVRGCERILSLAMPSPKRRLRPHEMDLGGGVRSFDGQITMTAATDLHTDPALALRVYRTAMTRSMPILPFAREAIARAAAEPAFGEALRKSTEAARLFGELVCSNLELSTRALSTPVRAGRSVLGELHDVGLLLAMIPEFCKVTGRVHHDVYHVYTVDVHSVAAVDCLRALARGELVSVHPLASRLAVEVAQEGRLYFATLLHDVGKGYPDRDGSRAKHSESGAQLAETIAPRLGFGEADTRAIALLIRNHLTMYHVATRRDLDDPSTIEEFARVVDSREALRNLYLLTVADITTTSPQAMTAWKARMLDELYFLTDAFLSGNREERPSVRAQVASPSVPDAFSQAFLRSMPERYFLATPPATIAAHLEVAFSRGADSFALGLAPAQDLPGGAASELLELCVVADDRPGLLARIAAALTANRLEVLSAQVYSRTTERGAEAVDVFSLRDRQEADAEQRERTLRAVRADLRRLLDDGLDPKELVRQYLGRPSTSPRRTPSVTPEVVFDDRASPQHTVVEVFAKDRPGLLFALSQALSDLGLTIALSKINTEGAKAADVFYVSDLRGDKLPPARFAEVRDALLRCVDPGAAAAPSANP